jgi:hypothetical protein
MISKQCIKFVFAFIIVISVSMFMATVVLAWEVTRTVSDPELGATNPDYLVNRTALTSLRNIVRFNSLVKSELYYSTRDKVKSQFKTMCYIDQASSALCSDLNIYDIYFPLNLPIKRQYTRMVSS